MSATSNYAEKKPWYLHPVSLVVGFILTISSVVNLINKLKDEPEPVSTYRAQVTIALKGDKISVKDTITLPTDSRGATGFIRYLPSKPIEERGKEISSFFVENIKAKVDDKDLIPKDRKQRTGFLTFSQLGPGSDLYYGKTLELSYELIGAMRKENAARYATLQLLNSDLEIDAKRTEILIYFPTKVPDPKKAAELYVGGLGPKHVKGFGRTHGQAKNVVEISLEGLQFSEQDVFLKLAWLDLSESSDETE